MSIDEGGLSDNGAMISIGTKVSAVKLIIGFSKPSNDLIAIQMFVISLDDCKSEDSQNSEV